VLNGQKGSMSTYTCPQWSLQRLFISSQRTSFTLQLGLLFIIV